MPKSVVFVTRKIPEPGFQLLREEGLEVKVNPYDRPLTKDEIIAGTAGADAIISLLTDKINAEIIEASSRLKIIANYAVGFNNIDLDAATARGIMVTNTPGILTETTADFAWALLMAVARRVVDGDAFVRGGNFKGWEPELLLGGDVYGKTLGIIGLGRIGRAVARRARGFNMKVIYYKSSGPDKSTERQLCLPETDENAEKKFAVEYRPLDELLREADFVSLHVPLNESTFHLIGEKELKMMKTSAYLINTARGTVIDEKALVKALQKGEIAGAGLDVFENEPTVAPELIKMPNVVLAPHIGSASRETRVGMAVMAAENVLAALRGEIVPNLVNKEVLKKTKS